MPVGVDSMFGWFSQQRRVPLVLLLLLASCPKKGTAPGTEAPPDAVPAEPAPDTTAQPANEGDVVEPRHVEEKVTVVNPTAFKIHVELSSAAPDQEEETASFGPIEAGGEGSGTIGVWTNGSFTVVARWEVEGQTIRSQPYTAMLDPSEPLTPVTCTLNLPYESGTLGVWSSVQWEMPPGMEPPD